MRNCSFVLVCLILNSMMDFFVRFAEKFLKNWLWMGQLWAFKRPTYQPIWYSLTLDCLMEDKFFLSNTALTPVFQSNRIVLYSFPFVFSKILGSKCGISLTENVCEICWRSSVNQRQPLRNSKNWDQKYVNVISAWTPCTYILNIFKNTLVFNIKRKHVKTSQLVTMLLFYQVATRWSLMHNLLANRWIAGR